MNRTKRELLLKILVHDGGEKIYGLKDISNALNINRKDKKEDTDKKRFQRMVKKYNFPIYKENRRIYMFERDIGIINNGYLLGRRAIANYMGIHIKTLQKWLKRYPKIPIDRKRCMASILELDYWYANLLNSRIKKGKLISNLSNSNIPIIENIQSLIKIKHTSKF